MTIKKILAKLRKADEMFGLIEDGDRIAVGVSGGKDSSLLLYALHLYQYLASNSLGKSFDLIGIHIEHTRRVVKYQRYFGKSHAAASGRAVKNNAFHFGTA